MLEGLDKIDWFKLEHAYGSAQDVPGLLKNLAYGQPEDVDKAWWQLYGNLWHQGTIYEASAYSVPFFVELLHAESAAGKSDILDFLHSLATGSSYNQAHQSLSIFKNESETEEWKTQLQEQLSWVNATYQAVSNYTQEYLRFLQDKDAAVRAAAVQLLSLFKEQVSQIIPQIWATVESESDNQRKVAMVMNVGDMLANQSRYGALFLPMLKSYKNEDLLLASAIAISKVSGSEAPSTVEDIILEALPRTTGDAVFTTSWLVTEGYEVLPKLGKERSIPALIQAIRVVNSSDTASEIAGILLDTVFNTDLASRSGRAYEHREDGKYNIDFWSLDNEHLSKPDKLTRLQKHALQTVIEADILWRIKTNLLELYGLPTTRYELRQFVNKQESYDEL